MGLEASCSARIGGRWQEGSARLEEKELVFRGPTRLRVPFAGMSAVQAERGVLSLKFDGRELAFRLGDRAADWARRIQQPRSRIEKLGVKPGMRVLVQGVDDEAFASELEARGATVLRRAGPSLDMVFVQCADRAGLARLQPLAQAIQPAGAIWVLWPKGGPGLREDDVRREGAPLGLVDVKVVSFSDRLSGLKMMIRRERRRPEER